MGAGGHHCPVARAFGEISAEEDVVVTQESETRVGAERLRALTPRYGSPELFAEPDFHGYGWYFTKGDFLNVGIGAMGGMPIAQAPRAAAHRAACERAPARRSRAHAVPRPRLHRAAQPTPAVSGDRFLLVGDAAGLARDFSGEGIGPAVRSARLAAEAVLGDDPGRYADACRGHLRPAVERHRRAASDCCPRGPRGPSRGWPARSPGPGGALVLEGAFGMG